MAVLISFNVYRLAQKSWDMGDPIDLRGLYLGAELWYEQAEVYNDTVGSALWQEHKEKEDFESRTNFGDQWVSIMVYPPHAFVISKVLTHFSWKTARIIWWSICISLLLLSAFLLYELSKNVLSIYLILAFKGTAFALILGQPLILVFCCILLSIHLQKRHPLIAGFFLGVAMIKFNLVIPFALWFLLGKKFNLLISAACTTGLLLLIAIWGQVELLEAYTQKLSAYYEMIYQRHPDNIYTYSDSELSMLLSHFIEAPIGVWKKFNLIGQLIGYSLIGYLAYSKKWKSSYSLLAFLLVSFLFTYHLTYDALLFLIPLMLIPNHKHRWYGILLFMCFALPWNAVFDSSELIKYNYPMFIMLGIVLFTFAKGKSESGQEGLHTPH